MNSAPVEPVIWKAPRWLFLFALIFGSQVLLIYLLSANARSASRPILAPSPSIQLITEPINDSKFSEIFLASDPTLFAMANPHGFSGEAWLKVPKRNYNLSDRVEVPFWLPLNSGQLGSGIAQFVRTNVVVPLSITENVAPKIFVSQFLDSSSNAKSNSQLRIEGDLALRKLIDSPELKTWAHTEILSNTVAQIAVDKSGTVISVRLLSRSGLAEADRAALTVAREIRFGPSGKSDATWGRLVFDWHTVPATLTNSPTEISK